MGGVGGVRDDADGRRRVRRHHRHVRPQDRGAAQPHEPDARSRGHRRAHAGMGSGLGRARPGSRRDTWPRDSSASTPHERASERGARRQSRTAPGPAVAPRAPRGVDVERRRSLAGSGRPSALARWASSRPPTPPRTSIAVDAVWSSDLVRARRTAEIVADERGRRRARRPAACASATPASGRATPAPRSRSAGPDASSRADRPAGYETDDALLDRVLVGHRRHRGRPSTGGTVLRRRARRRRPGPRASLRRGSPRPPPNLGGRWLVARDTDDGGAWSLGERVLLLEDVDGDHARADLTRLARGRPAGA